MYVRDVLKCTKVSIFCLILFYFPQLSELSVSRGEKRSAWAQMLIQGLGMFTGATIMLVIAIYEHDIEKLINGTL